MSHERKAGNWIKGFRFWTQESEAPDSFITWAAISTIAGVARRNVWIRWAYRNVYPNLYVILVGPPGTRKTTAAYFSSDCLHPLAIPMASESLSREALIDQFVERNKGQPYSALTVHSYDLMSFMKASGPAMVEFLTDIYDNPKTWEHVTRGSGSVTIRKPILNFFGCTTPAWIGDTFSISFVEQGFASRTIFVCEDKIRFPNAHPKETPEMQEMYKKILHDLAYISKIEGEFDWGSGYKWFEDWYNVELPKKRLDYRLKSYLERLPTHIIKVAMCLAMAEGDELVLHDRYLEAAKNLLELLEPNMVRAFSAIGSNKFANDIQRIYYDIRLAGTAGMSEETLYSNNFRSMQKSTLDEALEMLILGGLVTARLIDEKDKWFYVVDLEEE